MGYPGSILIVKLLTEGFIFWHTSVEIALPPLQMYPGSTVQDEEHPSPSILLPSSQSKTNFLPSPQISTHLPFCKLKPRRH